MGETKDVISMADAALAAESEARRSSVRGAQSEDSGHERTRGLLAATIVAVIANPSLRCHRPRTCNLRRCGVERSTACLSTAYTAGIASAFPELLLCWGSQSHWCSVSRMRAEGNREF